MRRLWSAKLNHSPREIDCSRRCAVTRPGVVWQLARFSPIWLKGQHWREAAVRSTPRGRRWQRENRTGLACPAGPLFVLS